MLWRASSRALWSAAVETPSLAASSSSAGPKPGPPPCRPPKPPRRNVGRAAVDDEEDLEEADCAPALPLPLWLPIA